MRATVIFFSIYRVVQSSAQLTLEHFYQSQNKPSTVNSHFPFSTKLPTFRKLLLVSIDLPFWTFYINRIMQFMVFCD